MATFFITMVVFLILGAMGAYALYQYVRRRIQQALDARHARRERYAATLREINHRHRELAVELRARWEANIAERKQLDETVHTLATVPSIVRRNRWALRSIHYQFQTPQLPLPLQCVPTLNQSVQM